VYLLDTNVVSELRKGATVNPGVREFVTGPGADRAPAFLSVITVGELRRGVELIRHRGDTVQAAQLEKWLRVLLQQHEDRVLPIDADIAQLWGRLRVPHHENALDKLLAATALIHNLVLVTRNVADYRGTGVRLLDPFT
jgi:toxin FitB